MEGILMKHRSIRVLCFVLLAMSLVALGGCNKTSSGGDKAPIRLGQATALTTEYTVVGQYLANGVKMAVDEINA
ncbi:MAG: hypothetical protein ABSD96_22860, partial [Candidatus Korobacteraceae bacterium]